MSMSNSITRVTTASVVGWVQPDGHSIRYRNNYSELKEVDLLDSFKDYIGKKVSLDISISFEDRLDN